MTKLDTNMLVLVNKCTACIQLEKLYSDAEQIERQLAWAKANQNFIHGDMLTVDELELLKQRKLSLIRTWESKECVCEFQIAFQLPYSNTGVKIDGGY